MLTVYQCGGCGAITNTVWSWNSRNLCRVCFGLERLGDGGSGGVQQSSRMTLVRADGTSVEVYPTTGKTISTSLKEVVDAGGASLRKIRIQKTEKKKS